MFFPRMPAIPGANYYDFLDDSDRKRVEASYGRQSAVEFFCFMLQVHEGVHELQVGEPLFNEIVQASLWIKFLDEGKYWDFQRNSVSGRSCNLEIRVVRRHPWIFQAAISSGLDTYSMIPPQSPGTYSKICGLAAQFDDHESTYGGYLKAAQVLLDELPYHS